MKKALLGTSALVGAGLLAFSPAPASANDLELSLSGNLILGTYIVDGEDYNAGAQRSTTFTGVGATSTGEAAVAVGPYRVCWDGEGTAATDYRLGDGVNSAGQNGTCPTGFDEVGSGAFTATTDRAAGGGSVTRATLGDKVEPNDIGIANAASRYVFNAKGVLDNGLGVGSRVRMEATSQTTAANQIDEHYVWVDGGFGLFQVGATNGASYKMHYAAPFFTNNGVDSPNFRNGQRSSAGTETYPDMSGDSYKLNYFTPRFSGIQLGASFAPDGSDTNGTRASNAVYNNLTVNLQDVYSFGANFTKDVGNVGVAVSGGYVTATSRNKNVDGSDRDCNVYGSAALGLPAGTTAVTSKCEDPSEWSVGTSLSMDGFTVGGAYNVRDNIGGVKDAEGTSWSAAVKYAEDAWNVGIGYYQGTVERGGAFSTQVGAATPVAAMADWDDAENTFLLLGAGYKLGSGVNLGAEVQIIEDTNPIAVISGDGLPNSARSSAPETIKTNSVGLTLAVGF